MGWLLPFVTVRDFSALSTCYAELTSRLGPRAGTSQIFKSCRFMKKLGAGVSILLSVWITSSLSASPRPTCDRSSSQPNMDACAYEDLQAAETEQESVYRSIVEKYASNSLLLKRLARAQQSWMKFREDDWNAQFACHEFNTQLCWGPQAFIKVNVRRMEQTKERTRSLRKLLENGPGQ